MNNEKVATIVPVNHLRSIEGDSYMLALSYLAIHPNYRNFFQTHAWAGSYVILDNSAIELGRPEPFSSYIRQATRMDASEILLPDYYRRPSLTLDAAGKSLRMLNLIGEYSGKIMVVPQGSSIDDWVTNMRELLALREGPYAASTVGISCRYTSLFFGNRGDALPLIEPLLANYPNLKVHLLGCYSDPREEIAPILSLDMVNGVDSSYPTVYTQRGMRLQSHMFGNVRPARRIDFERDSYDDTLLAHNIYEWRKACSSELDATHAP